MRKKTQKQMPLMITRIEHPHAEELEGISQILDAHPIIYEWVLQDVTRGVIRTDAGADGMSAEQVLRAAIIEKMTLPTSREARCPVYCHRMGYPIFLHRKCKLKGSSGISNT